MSVSADGFVNTPSRSLDWVVVDDELHSFFNDDAASMSTFLYGRRMYELMSDYWPTAEIDPAATPVMREFGRIWTGQPLTQPEGDADGPTSQSVPSQTGPGKVATTAPDLSNATMLSFTHLPGLMNWLTS